MDGSLAVSIPRLHTPRLTLREYRMADFDAFAAYLGNAEAMAYIGLADRKGAWRIFGCQAGLWVLQGAGWWAVELRETGQLVGNVGAFFREGWPEIEIGWNTFDAFWGRGIATEAAGEAVRYALEVRGERRVTALIDAGNTASIRVAVHLGMEHEGDTTLWDRPIRRYGRAP